MKVTSRCVTLPALHKLQLSLHPDVSAHDSLGSQHFLLLLDDWATSADGSLLEDGFISAEFMAADLISDR